MYPIRRRKLKLCNFTNVYSNVPGVFGNLLDNYLPMIKQMLQQSLVDAANANVRAQAVRAVCSFIIAHEKETTLQKHFQDLLPNMIQVMRRSAEMKTTIALFLTRFFSDRNERIRF